MQAPLVSIVIANYNYGRFLGVAIDSILVQSCQDFEIIVIDGGSTDNSVEVIKKFSKGLPPAVRRDDPSIACLGLQGSFITYWISEKDKGQSDAFNKGFAQARGRFLTWLNADDVMMPGTIERLKIAAEQHPKCEWFVGGVMWLTKDMRIIKMGRGRPFSHMRARSGSVGVWGPSSFFTHSLLTRAGGVDVRFHYAMDNDLWYRFYYKCCATYLPFLDYAWGLRLHENAKMSGHNFTTNGQYKEGTADLVDKNSAKAKQLWQEGEWMREIYRPKHPMNFWRQLISMSVYESFMSRIDTFLYKGRYYLEYFS